MSKPIKIIFTLSLLLNLVMLGMAGGCLWKRYDHPRPFQNTAESTQAAFRAAFEKNRPAMRADMDSIRQSRETLESIMTAETFDRAAYDNAVQGVLNTRDGINRRRAEILGEVLSTLPVEERRKVTRKIISKLTEERPSRHCKDRSAGHGPDGQEPSPPPQD